ncbi:hypothetical protein BCD64_01025 [Nostoc sp. MBR 210]|nr:hypothetical protein BCD64_01025 [Nostoc sp. MBR 210]
MVLKNSQLVIHIEHFLLNIFIRYLDGDMKGIPDKLLNQLHELFSECEQFNSHSNLKTMFSYASLSHLENELPEADSKKVRVEKVTQFLFKEYTNKNENCLVLFIRVLITNTKTQNLRYHQLVNLADELERYITSIFTAEKPDNNEKKGEDNRYDNDKLNRSLSADQPLSLLFNSQLFDCLLSIDFKDQEACVTQAIEWQKKRQRTVAFLINGYDDKYGQSAFIERLFRKIPEFKHEKEIIKIKLESGWETSNILQEIAKFFGLDYISINTSITSSEDIQDKIINKACECLQFKNLIFVFYIPQRFFVGLLADLINDFWEPMVDRVNHKDTYLTMFLVESNHKEKGLQELSNKLAPREDDSSYPIFPLYLPLLSKFSRDHLEKWLENGVEDEEIRHKLLVGTQQKNFVDTLLKETEWGIPERVYKKICNHFSVRWEDINQCQI